MAPQTGSDSDLQGSPDDLFKIVIGGQPVLNSAWGGGCPTSDGGTPRQKGRLFDSHIGVRDYNQVSRREIPTALMKRQGHQTQRRKVRL
jgi:hypothetical protein